MKLTSLAACAALLLAGCATTIRSDVTTFQQWPAQLAEHSYQFEAPAPQEDTLEWRSYQQLVRGELNGLGLVDAGAGGKAALLVSMHFTTADAPVRVIEVDPFVYGPRWGYPWPYYRHFGWWGPYDPFWGSPAAYSDTVEQRYSRELKVSIREAAGDKRLFDVTVRNLSRNASTPALMPAMVHSAFVGFPGPNGAARRIELKQEAGAAGAP